MLSTMACHSAMSAMLSTMACHVSDAQHHGLSQRPPATAKAVRCCSAHSAAASYTNHQLMLAVAPGSNGTDSSSTPTTTSRHAQRRTLRHMSRHST
jgi:hypothetical protein